MNDPPVLQLKRINGDIGQMVSAQIQMIEDQFEARLLKTEFSIQTILPLRSDRHAFALERVNPDRQGGVRSRAVFASGLGQSTCRPSRSENREITGSLAPPNSSSAV